MAATIASGVPECARESCVHSGNGGIAGHVGNLEASNLILGQLQHSMDVDTISRSIDGSNVVAGNQGNRQEDTDPISSRTGQHGTCDIPGPRPSCGTGWWARESNSQEPVEQLPPEAQADGSVVDVEGEVLLRLEVQVGKWQLQVHHLDPAREGTVRPTQGLLRAGSRQHSLADVVVELPLLPVQV